MHGMVAFADRAFHVGEQHIDPSRPLASVAARPPSMSRTVWGMIQVGDTGEAQIKFR